MIIQQIHVSTLTSWLDCYLLNCQSHKAPGPTAVSPHSRTLTTSYASGIIGLSQNMLDAPMQHFPLREWWFISGFLFLPGIFRKTKGITQNGSLNFENMERIGNQSWTIKLGDIKFWDQPTGPHDVVWNVACTVCTVCFAAGQFSVRTRRQGRWWQHAQPHLGVPWHLALLSLSSQGQENYQCVWRPCTDPQSFSATCETAKVVGRVAWLLKRPFLMHPFWQEIKSLDWMPRLMASESCARRATVHLC